MPPSLPRPRLPTASWLSPSLAAIGLWAVMAAVATQPAATQRSLVFLGGPLLLLAGLHGRLYGFLHAPDRARWLPLPISPARHFRAALVSQRPMFWLSAALGGLAVWSGAPSHATSRGLPVDLGLTLELGWLVLVAAGIEPCVAGVAAALGRRFAADSPIHALQRNLGGGWTTPEAVVHLYAPAFGVALAVLLAMPGQLSLERWLDGGPLDARLLAIGAAPLLIALALRLAAPILYAAGLWEAVPWLAEATRTLAGPPRPEATPTWASALRDPWVRLLAIQFWRVTPLPGLRLALLFAVSAILWVRTSPPSALGIALALAVVGVWVIPVGAVSRDRLARARIAGALPLAARARTGRASAIALLLLLAPVLVLAASLAYRVTLDGVTAAQAEPAR